MGPTRIGAVLRGVPNVLRLIALVLAVGALIEVLPLDLAVVAVLVASMHLSTVAGAAWTRLRVRLRRG